MPAVAARSSMRSKERVHSTYVMQADIPTVDKVAPAMLWKTLLDRGLASLLLIPGLPLVILLIAVVRLTSRGPGIYSQLRVGKSGKVFTMYKLRSMRIDAESATGPVWSAVNGDSRVTWVGQWLRRLHLDELPQLFNVLRGEMSLVGPRPERPEFVKVLAEQIPGYLDRLTVLPGVTGLAQLNLPPDTDLDSVRRKLRLDCEYIRGAGFLFDLRIIACTVLRVVGLRHGLGVRLLGLQRMVTLTPSHSIGDQAESQRIARETIVVDKVNGKTVTYKEIQSFCEEVDNESKDSDSLEESRTGTSPVFGEA